MSVSPDRPGRPTPEQRARELAEEWRAEGIELIDNGLPEEPRAASGHARVLDLWRTADRLGLTPYLSHLYATGYCVLPPEVLGISDGFADELRDTVLAKAERLLGGGYRLDPDGDFPAGALDSPYVEGWLRRFYTGGYHMVLDMLLDDGKVFEEAVQNEAVHAVLNLLVGEGCYIGAGPLALIKGRGLARGTVLHADEVGLPHLPPAANVTWLLSDYSPDDGALCFVPGSHLLGRAPSTPDELAELREGVVARKGSVVIFNSNTWHGSFPKLTKGLRVAMPTMYYRAPGVPGGGAAPPVWRDRIDEEILHRNPPLLRRLCGVEELPPGAEPPGLAENENMPEFITGRRPDLPFGFPVSPSIVDQLWA